MNGPDACADQVVMHTRGAIGPGHRHDGLTERQAAADMIAASRRRGLADCVVCLAAGVAGPGILGREMTRQRERADPRADPAVRFAVMEIVNDDLDKSSPELAEDLEHRVDYPDQYGGEAIARIPDGWVIDWRDVARLALQDLEREDPPLVQRVTQPDRDLVRFETVARIRTPL